MFFDSYDIWWWPYVFITLAAVLPTSIWRWLGVFVSGNLDETSEWLVLVRAIATAIVAAVIANLLLFPTGPLSQTPVWLRITGAGAAFAAYQLSGRKIYVGILVAEIIVIGGAYVLDVF